ncbi:MAG TPA: hypothetical protein VE954_12125 [Oligoflexus sp.]|uniref:hypothetical protein n=1 Tax=Oligoflexus sp. TaxID=1971216 RepID=UPI002D44B542|nr:hypothetical protein [Oligoflexus sp.]HYX33853.1 hypothetical protein [Oligoflexus sp.]
MGPAKIKRWFENRGVAVKAVATVKIAGTPVITGFQITTKNGKKGKIDAKARAHDLENLRRELLKA